MATVASVQPWAYMGIADLAAIADLINACRVADQLESRTSIARLQEDYADPQFDRVRDLRLWRDHAGRLVAVAELWRSLSETELVGQLDFDIHPELRGSHLAGEVVMWAEQRLQEAGQSLSRPLVLHSGCRDSEGEWRSLLLQLGFAPERYFYRLRRSLADPIPVSPLPAGWTIRTVTPDDAAAWVTMFNQTFVDHWNHQPMTVEEFHYYATLSDYDPDLDLVLVTPTGELVTFCSSEIKYDRNARLGRQEGHVCLLGTRRGYRRQGLAKLLLLESLRRLQALEMAIATIGVDAHNPLGALKLYESVGFEQLHSSTVFRKAVG